jgi:NADH:ubiquinone oxidoreductase subunit K
MGVELILNSANINYVAFSHFGSGNADGQSTRFLSYACRGAALA